MIRVNCNDCIHFRKAPYQAPRTGCWHPDSMKVTQKEAFLDEQQQPGNHRKINLRGDCGLFEQGAAKLSFLKRLFKLGA
ncbi:MAG: hypothetical protein O2816_01280 [Planctomycetota bacterium]|nr:hypothetical protein [Planctomycetota bacterium]